MSKAYCEACHFELIETETQYCSTCTEELEQMIMDQFKAWEREKRSQASEPMRDYEPEQAYGSPDDYRKHCQYGGNRNDY